MEEAETADVQLAEETIATWNVPQACQDEAAWALRHAGLAYILMGQKIPAIACWFAACDIWTQLENSANAAAMQVNLGGVYADVIGDQRKAQKYLEEARLVLEEQEAVYDRIKVYNNLAGSYFYIGEFCNALDTQNCLFELAEKGFPVEHSEALDMRATIWATTAHWKYAERDFKEAIQKSQEVKNISGQSMSVANLGMLYLNWAETLGEEKKHNQAVDKYALAEEQFVRYLELYQGIPSDEVDPDVLMQVYTGLAEVFLQTNQPDKASAQVQRADVLTPERFSVKARWQRIRGKVLWQQGRLEEAERLLLEAWEAVEKHPIAEGQIDLWILKDIISFYKSKPQEQAGFAQKLKERLSRYKFESNEYQEDKNGNAL